MPKKITKSADTGKIVSKEFAKDNPETTFETEVGAPTTMDKVLQNAGVTDDSIVTVVAPKNTIITEQGNVVGDAGEVVFRKDPATKLVYGQQYLFTGPSGSEFIGALQEPTDANKYPRVTVYEVVGGCQSERTIDIPDVSAYKTKLLSREEVFKRLSDAGI